MAENATNQGASSRFGVSTAQFATAREIPTSRQLERFPADLSRKGIHTGELI
jgi:hypothetical protein